MSSLTTPPPQLGAQPSACPHATGLGTWVQRHPYVSVLILSALVRIAWALMVPVVPTSDSVAYDKYAVNLATHNVYAIDPSRPSAFWPVGTSFLYSLLYRTFGHHYSPIVVLNLLLELGIIALAMLLAARWHGRRTAIATGLILCLWPMHVEFTTVLASELPFTLALLTALALWERSATSPIAKPLLVGLLLAAASYVRPTALLLPAVFLAISCFRERRLIGPLLRTSIVLAAMAALIAPWTLRNARLFGTPVLISTNGGTNTWMGNNPASTGTYMVPPDMGDLNEAEKDRRLKDLAVQYIRAHPLAFVERSAVKLVKLHDRESIGVVWNPGLAKLLPPVGTQAIKLLSCAFWWAVLTLALLGIVLQLTRTGLIQVIAHPAVAIWAYFAAVHAVTVIQDRYHFPVTPFVGILAALTLASTLFHRSPLTSPDPSVQ